MKISNNQVFAFCERLGSPFLFLEEREIRLRLNATRSFTNGLPKILFILEGNLECSINDMDELECHSGKVLINLERNQQSYKTTIKRKSGYLKALRLTLIPEAVESCRKATSTDENFLDFCMNRLPAINVVDAPTTTNWNSSLGQLRQELVSNQPSRRHRIHTLARSLLLELAEAQTQELHIQTGQRLIEKIEAFLETNLSQSINLDEIAHALDRSGEHLVRQYRYIRGHTIFTELRQRRIEKAKYYLLCTDWPAGKIADKCGFSTPALFSRSFREITGLNPRTYRESQRLSNKVE